MALFLIKKREEIIVMARLKPRVTIPYKRYERSFESSVESNEQADDEPIVLKDITANPTMTVSGIKPERLEEDAPEIAAPDNQKSEHKPTSDLKEITLNKKIKIRRKTR